MLDYTGLRNGLVVTAFWKAKPDETEAVAAILQRFMPQAQQEPGVRAFMIHQSKSEPSEFFFYEVFEKKTPSRRISKRRTSRRSSPARRCPSWLSASAPNTRRSERPRRHGRDDDPHCPGHRRGARWR
jgi:hypothetical protein